MPTFFPKRAFTLSGSNMNFTRRVMFGREEVTDFEYLDNTGISGVVPDAAYTQDLTIESNAATLNLGVQQVALDSLSQIVVSGLQPEDVSGKAGKLITITGENFHQITDVNFGDISGAFNVLSPSEIEVRVPQNADFGGVTVFSSLRTGLAGSISQASGISVNQFVPIPEVTGLSSNQLTTGETLTVQGSSFSGVTGVSVNGIEFNSVSVPNSTGVQAQVPSGYVSGIPVLNLKSGISYSSPSTILFNPLAKITGVAEGVERGDLLTISGQNFDSGIMYSGQEYDRYLVSLGNTTGNFKILDGNRMSGVVPLDFEMTVSGGNVAVGQNPISSSGLVSIFSTNFPEDYPSNKFYTPKVGAPTITSINPESGIPGDSFIISGTNLFGITGLAVSGTVGAIGFGTESPGISQLVVGTTLGANIPSNGVSHTFPNTGELLAIGVSGYFGSATSPANYNVLGIPTINSIIPDTDVLPGSTGTVYGTNLYSGTTLSLRNNVIAPAGYLSDLSISGYLNNDKEIVFNYPNSFATGTLQGSSINYKIRAHNRRGNGGLEAVTVIAAPSIDGPPELSPLSGEFGDNVIISGFFEGVRPSGLTLGNRIISEYSQSGTTGIHFTIPLNSLSDVVNIDTSGGLISTTGILGISPSKPAISGYYAGAGEAPSTFDYNQIISPGGFLSITGSRLNLVTGVNFTGVGANTNPISGAAVIEGNVFWQKRPNNLIINIPEGIHTGDGSGLFELKDFKNRTTSSTTVSNSGINVPFISDYTSAAPAGSNFVVSGFGIEGLDVLFTQYDGQKIKGASVSSSGPGISGVCSLTVQVPTGLIQDTFQLTGRSNTEGITSLNDYELLPTITGISGFNSSRIASTGIDIFVTGINAPVESFIGENLIGISGSGDGTNTPMTTLLNTALSGDIATGTGVGFFSSRVSVELPSSFIGTGQFFFLRNSYPSDEISTFGDSDDVISGFLAEQISYFPDLFVVTGTRVNATGYGPTRGVTGENVLISGAGFNEVTGVFFQIPSGEPLQSNFVINSDTKITAPVPKEAIESRGMTSLLLSGGTNDTVGDFEVILDASVVEFNIVEENDVPASSTRVGNFTQKETINGVVFLVTRTRFPDGTTAVISSVPAT